MLSAVVLAAGMSTRMGQNKLLLNFQEKPLIVHAIDTLLASQIGEIVVVLGHQFEKVRQEIEGRQVRVVQNPDYQDGLSTSLRTGVMAISEQAEGIMVHLADQPLVDSTDVNRIVAAFATAKAANKSIVVPFFQGERGNPVILDASFRGDMLKVVGDTGCNGLIKRYPEKVYTIEMQNDHVVRDVDDAQGYERLVG